MWKTFLFENISYILKVSYTTNYKILLTDLTNLWIEELTKEQICLRCKELNPRIETDDDTFLNTTISLLTDDNCDIIYNLTKNNDAINLECKSKMEEIYFKFAIELQPSNILMFCEEFTKPMIHTIQLLEKQQEKLCDIIEKKDNEIKRHNFENGEITKKNLITEKFNKEENIFSPKHLCCNIFTNSECFNDNRDIEVKQEKEEIPQPEVKKRPILTLAHKIMAKRIKKSH